MVCSTVRTLACSPLRSPVHRRSTTESAARCRAAAVLSLDIRSPASGSVSAAARVAPVRGVLRGVRGWSRPSARDWRPRPETWRRASRSARIWSTPNQVPSTTWAAASHRCLGNRIAAKTMDPACRRSTAAPAARVERRLAGERAAARVTRTDCTTFRRPTARTTRCPAGVSSPPSRPIGSHFGASTCVAPSAIRRVSRVSTGAALARRRRPQRRQPRPL